MMLKTNLRVPLTGYTDRLSARGGDTIAFKLSAHGQPNEQPANVNSWLTQSICADPNPSGPGIIERDASQWYKPDTHTVSEQGIFAGSFAITSPINVAKNTTSMHLGATIWPTLLNNSIQCIAQFGALRLFISSDNLLSCSFNGNTFSLPEHMQTRCWMHVSAHLKHGNAQTHLTLSAQALPQAIGTPSLQDSTEKTSTHLVPEATKNPIQNSQLPLIIAAERTDSGTTTNHFNGKLESPKLCLSNNSEPSESSHTQKLSWNFAHSMNSLHIADVAGHGVTLSLKNFPTRAMKSSTWSGNEMCWRHAPEQYNAIHFHDDDLVDANWETTFNFTLPSDMRSGVYVMHISDGQNTDAMPFFVCAPKSQPTSKLCVLVSTFTYAIYGNHARPDWDPSWQEQVKDWNAYPHNPAQYPGYGLSTYNNHSDGSGICHASHLRPLFNLRPGYITFGNTTCSGLRHFQADSHLLSWLDAMNIDFDIITDREVHTEGVACIAGYDMLLTGSHPEYHTAQTLDALHAYRDTGGHLSYLGGNGFYWRIALHQEHEETLEIRRAEAGIRAWAAEPGEYYQAFDGQYGGLWRRNGRPPQALCGLGFSAQGQFNGSYYQRSNTDAEYAWVFEGIEGDVIGDFGLCGAGAAGFELDRADQQLGTPDNTVVLASSKAHSDDFILVPEEMLTHLTTLPGPDAQELVRADMVWFDVPNGGSVFSVGSITFCGSLPHNNFDNNVSRLMKNVVDHVLDPT